MLTPPLANFCLDEAAHVVSFLAPISLHHVISTNHELKKRFRYKNSLELARYKQQPNPLADQVMTAIKTIMQQEKVKPLYERNHRKLVTLLRVALRQDDPQLTPIKETTLGGDTFAQAGFVCSGNVRKWATHFQTIEKLEIISKTPHPL